MHKKSWTSSLSPPAVNEIDLSLWRSSADIADDKREFMYDGGWELLSILSHYWKSHQDDTDYAHIQFNVSILWTDLSID